MSAAAAELGTRVQTLESSTSNLKADVDHISARLEKVLLFCKVGVHPPHLSLQLETPRDKPKRKRRRKKKAKADRSKSQSPSKDRLKALSTSSLHGSATRAKSAKRSPTNKLGSPTKNKPRKGPLHSLSRNSSQSSLAARGRSKSPTSRRRKSIGGASVSSTSVSATTVESKTRSSGPHASFRRRPSIGGGGRRKSLSTSSDKPDDLEKQRLLRNVPLFKPLTKQEIAYFASMLKRRRYDADDFIIYQGETKANDLFIVESGECAVYLDPVKNQDADTDADAAAFSVEEKAKEVGRYTRGGCFGERALIHDEPRAASVKTLTETTVLVLGRKHFHDAIIERENREETLRNCKLLEMLNNESIAKLAAVLETRSYRAETTFVKQGDEGREFFIVKSGECHASVSMGADGTRSEQIVKRYGPGDLFGELALLNNAPRAASITATTDCTLLVLERDLFEKMLGPLSQIQAQQYLADPRKLIADFYRDGNQFGPAGFMKDADEAVPQESKTSWFAVYRPTSTESIAKMLDRAAAGKGLNIKGKSAKKNRLSGFVPFVQISDNAHKTSVEKAPSNARVQVFYQEEDARSVAQAKLSLVLQEMLDRKMAEIDRPEITVIHDFEPSTFGLDIPEAVLTEVYIMRPNLTPVVGWETGRESEPAFLNMNLHTVRDEETWPRTVIYQFDKYDPLNPAGLLMAYAEKDMVKPVVSDFDTFLIGSRNMNYIELAEEQQTLMKWTIEQTKNLLAHPGTQSWSARWLALLRSDKAQDVKKIPVPQFGFGDPTSCGLIEQAVKVTGDCGAIRHGAECFNFYFPQELDQEFLVVWSGFAERSNYAAVPWKYLSEPDLRKFLLQRVQEDFAFPLNPVWPLRDDGWYEVLQALRESKAAQKPLKAWYPSPELLAMIDKVHKQFPDGFVLKESANRVTWDGMKSTTDLDACDVGNLAEEVVEQNQKRWSGVNHKMSRSISMGLKRIGSLFKRDSSDVAHTDKPEISLNEA